MLGQQYPLMQSPTFNLTILSWIIVSLFGCASLNRVTQMNTLLSVSLYQYAYCLYGSEMISMSVLTSQVYWDIKSCAGLQWFKLIHRILIFLSMYALLHRSSIYGTHQGSCDVSFTSWTFVLPTKWLRILLLSDIDIIRNYSVANPM